MVAMPAHANGYVHAAPLFNTPRIEAQSAQFKPGLVEDVHGYADKYRQAREKINTQVIWATPKWASEILANNKLKNRKVTRANVDKVIRAIKSGRWDVNGETVVFDENWNVIDGHHRIISISEAGIPVPILIATGVDPKTFRNQGQGRKRSPTAVITIDDISSEVGGYSTQVAATLAWLYRYENGQFPNKAVSPDNSEVVPLYSRYKGIADSVKYIATNWQDGLFNPSLYAAFHYLFGQKSVAARDNFFLKVVEGIGVSKDTTEHSLRRWLENMRKAGASPTPRELIIGTIKAWNNVRSGLKPLQKLSVTEDEQAQEIL